MTGCGLSIFHQPGTDVDQIYSRVFMTDYNTAWQAVLEGVKRYDKTVQNRQSGIVETVWTDNTNEKNFIEAFGSDVTHIKAHFRFRVSVAPGTFHGKPSVRVSVLKDQWVQRDLLEGWKPTKTDSIEENTLLYRIGRIIHIKQRLKQIEEEKMKEALEQQI